MKPRVILALILTATLGAACRQPDGPIPALDAQNENRIGDLARDLQGVAGGHPGSRQEFTAGLAVFADEHVPEALETVRGFAGRLADAVAASSGLTDETARQVAHTSWQLIGVTELSDRQVKELQGELRSQLAGVGVPQDRVDAVVAEMPTVQRAVTTRPRRWHEIF